MVEDILTQNTRRSEKVRHVEEEIKSLKLPKTNG
jgi:hypothetical protein